jgi:hypothetical protein
LERYVEIVMIGVGVGNGGVVGEGGVRKVDVKVGVKDRGGIVVIGVDAVVSDEVDVEIVEDGRVVVVVGEDVGEDGGGEDWSGHFVVLDLCEVVDGCGDCGEDEENEEDVGDGVLVEEECEHGVSMKGGRWFGLGCDGVV